MYAISGLSNTTDIYLPPMKEERDFSYGGLR
jgi:hypothetical protein